MSDVMNASIARLSANAGGLATWAAGLAIAIAVLLLFDPRLLFTHTTPAGYDMAGHVYPLHVAVHELIPTGHIHGWDDGWFGGFPLYWFYFPLPALVVAALSPLVGFLPAVKLTSIAGAVLLPLAIAWLVREVRMPALPSVGAVVLGSASLLVGSHSFYGGNLESTLAGEFSYSLAFALSVAWCAALVRARRRGESEFVLPAVLLAATALSHIVPAMAAVLASLPFLLERRGRRVVVPAWLLGFGLAGFWAVPFLLRIRPLGLWANAPANLGEALPLELLPLLPLAALGAYVAWRDARPLLWLAVPALIGLVLFWFPTGPVHPGRMLPSWFLGVHLLAGAGFGYALVAARAGDADDRRRAARMLGAGVAIVLAATPAALREKQDLGAWAAFNYSGIEAREGWPELASLMAAVRAQPPGLIYWNESPRLAMLGSRHLFSLLPYWAPGHSALHGLWLESSVLTPAVLAANRAVTLAMRAETPESATAAWSDALGRLRALGVDYFIAIGTRPRDAVVALTGTPPLYESPVFSLLQLPGAPIVESVGGGSARVIHADETRIEFETNAPGTPHLVRVPYFPNWTATNAVGPIEVEPGFMGVIPTGERVVLRFRHGRVEHAGIALTIVGILTAIGLTLHGRRRRR